MTPSETDPATRGRELTAKFVVAAKGQMSCELAGEAVILDMESGTYFGLNEVGARVWSLIQEPRAVRDIQEVILREYEVEPERCGEDLDTLLRDMSTAGLIEVQDGSPA